MIYNRRTNQVMYEGTGRREAARVPTHRIGDETSGDGPVPDHIRVVHAHHLRTGLPFDNMLPPLLPQNNAAYMPCRPASTSESSTTIEAVQGHTCVGRHGDGLTQAKLTHDSTRLIPLNHFKIYEWDHSSLHPALLQGLRVVLHDPAGVRLPHKLLRGHPVQFVAVE